MIYGNKQHFFRSFVFLSACVHPTSPVRPVNSKVSTGPESFYTFSIHQIRSLTVVHTVCEFPSLPPTVIMLLVFWVLPDLFWSLTWLLPSHSWIPPVFLVLHLIFTSSILPHVFTLKHATSQHQAGIFFPAWHYDVHFSLRSSIHTKHPT